MSNNDNITELILLAQKEKRKAVFFAEEWLVLLVVVSALSWFAFYLTGCNFIWFYSSIQFCSLIVTANLIRSELVRISGFKQLIYDLKANKKRESKSEFTKMEAEISETYNLFRRKKSEKEINEAERKLYEISKSYEVEFMRMKIDFEKMLQAQMKEMRYNLSEGLSQVDKYKYEMEQLSRNLGALNTIYGDILKQMKGKDDEGKKI